MNSVFYLPIINYDNFNIINPFNNYFFKSAEMKLEQLKITYSDHSNKYDYLLGIVDAIKQRNTSIPKKVIDDLLEQKLIEKQATI